MNVRISGHSMMPLINHGDWILVSLDINPDNLKINEIILLEDPINKELLIKRIESIETKNEKKFYVIGDNINDSYDSRTFGSIKKESIIGKPILRYWPLNKIKKL
jgi:signal peptidase I